MQKKSNKWFTITGILLLLFLLFTVMVLTVDVQPIGPEQSTVGLAALNQFALEFFRRNLLWYEITEFLGIAAMATALGFAVFGLVQWIKRKSIRNLDARILLLGTFYFIGAAVYVFFELVIVNYRPVLLTRNLEAFFPSSHVMLVTCIMVTAMLQFHHYLSARKVWLWATDLASILIVAATVIGRLLSGVHWFTDVAAGIVLSSALIALYASAVKYVEEKQRQESDGIN